MKIVFGKNDSIYKIFKTVEKINSKKKVVIQIDPQNVFFENIWRGTQIKEILEDNDINYEFLALDIKSQRYFMQLDVDFDIKKGSIYLKLLQKIYDFFIKASSVHKNVINRKNYISYGIIIFEILVVIYLFYFFYNLISPSAEIYIKPSYTVESLVYNFRYYPYYETGKYDDSRFLAIPYHTGSIKVHHTINIPVQSISYLNKPSKGKLRIYNYSDYEYPLLTNTKFVTEDGLVFSSKNWIDVKGGTKENPFVVDLDVQAVQSDLSGNIIGDKGNIASGTMLYIKNLKEGYYLKELYAQARGDFDGGETNKDGVVQQQDIDILNGKLADYMNANKKILLSDTFTDKDKLLLDDSDFISLTVDNISINSKPGEKLTNIEGSVEASIHIRYVLWNDFKSILDKYLKDRTSPNRKLMDIQKDSVSFGKRVDYTNVFAYPTKVDMIWGYDFENDINGLKNEIISKLLNKDKNEAKNIILDYTEISYASIDVRPNWYEILPSLKSRINIKIGD